MENLIFDTHAHYDDEAFDEDREELLSGLFGKGVGTVVDAAASARTMPEICVMAGTYDFLYFSAGLHPCETYCCGDNAGKPVMHFEGPDHKNFSALFESLRLYDENEIILSGWTAQDREEQLIEEMLKNEKCVAVGEIGLDYHYDDTRKDVQKEWFARQIAIARKHRLPVIIHSRDAAADTLDMVRCEQCADVGGIIHCFSYSREIAAKYMDMGFMIGIGGVVTYKNAVRIKEVVGYMPMDRMVLETDCPYLAPAPYRGKRNDSSMIRFAVRAISQIRNIPEDEIIRITRENAEKVYGIGK